MPRTPGIRRYIFKTFTVVSLLMMLGVMGLWAVSHFRVLRYEKVSVRSSNAFRYVDRFEFQTGRGGLTIRFEDGTTTAKPNSSSYLKVESVCSDFFDKYWFEFRSSWYQTSERKVEDVLMTIPHWFPALIFAIIPAIWLFKWNKRRKLNPNACTSCGYDLTGNESGVCPECGATAESSSDSA